MKHRLPTLRNTLFKNQVKELRDISLAGLLYVSKKLMKEQK